MQCGSGRKGSSSLGWVLSFTESQAGHSADVLEMTVLHELGARSTTSGMVESKAWLVSALYFQISFPRKNWTVTEDEENDNFHVAIIPSRGLDSLFSFT